MGLQTIKLPDANLAFQSAWLGAAEADGLLVDLLHELSWEQRQIRLFGRTHQVPRLTAWHGEPGAAYRYSGILHEAKAWSPALRRLLSKLQETTAVRFNSVLANHYRDGQDSMGWHSDDEPELGRSPLIASVSVGQSRRFRFRHRARNLSHNVEMTHGSLLLMSGDTQQYWQHAVPKTRKVVGGRINLTFRSVCMDSAF